MTDEYAPAIISSADASRFWQWFSANAARFGDDIAAQEPLLDELSDALQRAQPGLTFEIGFGHAVPNELVISADGRLELFDAVVALVSAAPSVPGWTVVPFRQPRGTHLVVEAAGQSLSPDDIWFRSERDGILVGLTLFVRGLSDDTLDFVKGASFLLLDAALGEYTMETGVGFVEWEPLPPNPEARGLHPFHALPQLVSGWTPSA